MNSNDLKSIIRTLLIKANTTLDREVYDYLKGIKNNDERALIFENIRLASETKRPLCQDTGQVLVFLKLPYDFSFGFDFKKAINEAVAQTYKDEFYRKSTVKNGLFDRENTGDNTPSIIYTDFENRETVKIDVLIKGGGAENMSFIEMFNPTASEDEILTVLSEKIKERAQNACPPLFLGIGAGGTMDYASLLSKKALFEGDENEFCKELEDKCNSFVEKIIIPEGECGYQTNKPAMPVICAKMISTSTHIASMPVAVTINCHSNRHACCEIGKNGFFYNDTEYEILSADIDFSKYKKINTSDIQEIKELQPGEKILLSGIIYTMRDAAHKKADELLDKGEKLPFDIKNSVIFYAGPAPKKEGEIVGPVGPTTAKRMDKYAPRIYDLGCIATIGKGVRSQEVIDSCKRNNAHYLSAKGGVACLLQKSFKKAELIAFEELGAEAIYKFEIENLPLRVEV